MFGISNDPLVTKDEKYKKYIDTANLCRKALDGLTDDFKIYADGHFSKDISLAYVKKCDNSGCEKKWINARKIFYQ